MPLFSSKTQTLTILYSIQIERAKKRKMVDPPSKLTPPLKKPAIAPSTASKPTLGTKRDPSKPVTKDSKTDSSFFSSKPKPKLPSFRKVSNPTSGAPGVKKEEHDSSVAQPNSIDPFQEALKSMGKAGNIADRSTTPLSDIASSSSQTVRLGKNGKPKKKVTFPPDDQLEHVKLIDKAIYDDDLGQVCRCRGRGRLSETDFFVFFCG